MLLKLGQMSKSTLYNNLANITITESDYQSLLVNGAFLDIRIISVKVLPDDSELKDDETYKQLQKEYKKARNKLEDYRFNKTTNR
jgi:F0F1-type ATP synthase epsilon subunit